MTTRSELSRQAGVLQDASKVQGTGPEGTFAFLPFEKHLSFI